MPPQTPIPPEPQPQYNNPNPPPSVFQPNTPPQAPMPMTPEKPKRFSRKIAIIVGLVLLLLIIGGGAYALFGQKTPYQNSVDDFITAVQQKNKAAADKLESPAAQAGFQKTDGTSSFYDNCQKNGILCSSDFQTAFLSKATKTYQNYTAANGTKGKEVTYTLKQSTKGTTSSGQACTSTSTLTLTVAVVPSGRSWLVDYVGQNISAQSGLCSQGSSQTTQTTQTTTTTPASTAKTQTSTSSGSTSTTQVSSAANDQQAQSQANSIQSLLEGYQTYYGYYPGDLSPEPLINTPGVEGASASIFTAPTGTKFVYTASPSGCTTAAQNCQHYTLVAEETNGTVIATIQSFQ